MIDVRRFDSWIDEGGPAALVMREYLEPVEGPDGVFFPATFAAAEDKSKFPGGYNIDVFPVGGASNVDNRFRPTIDTYPTSPNSCLVDSVGSQANRIEPVFERSTYSELVPQVTIKVADRRVSLFRAGHRAADALVRFSKAAEIVWNAFQELQLHGNALPMAKFAPTSIVFGAWDSRGTQAKVPRVFRSVIRAQNVRKLSRSAQFNRAIKFVEEGVIDESLDVGDGDKNPLSREGFKDSPATASHGGVIATGDIVREVTINLVAIRRLRSGSRENQNDLESTLILRRYILGLALVAGTAVNDDMYDLREGCQLREKPGAASSWRVVPHRGADMQLSEFSPEIALSFASAAATAFGVGAPAEYEFDKKAAEKWLTLKKEDQEKLRRKGPITQQFDSTDQTANDNAGEVQAPPKKSRGKR